MAFWTETFMNKMRNAWMKNIAKIQYCANNIWYDALITSKTISGNSLKIISQTTDSIAMTITAVRLIDSAGDIAGQMSENISKTASQGVITLWEFPLYELTD